MKFLFSRRRSHEWRGRGSSKSMTTARSAYFNTVTVGSQATATSDALSGTRTTPWHVRSNARSRAWLHTSSSSRGSGRWTYAASLSRGAV